MTEIERAIEYWEEFDKEIDQMLESTQKGSFAFELLTKQKPEVQTALAALREKQERGKGCEGCKLPKVYIFQNGRFKPHLLTPPCCTNGRNLTGGVKILDGGET